MDWCKDSHAHHPWFGASYHILFGLHFVPEVKPHALNVAHQQGLKSAIALNCRSSTASSKTNGVQKHLGLQVNAICF